MTASDLSPGDAFTVRALVRNPGVVAYDTFGDSLRFTAAGRDVGADLYRVQDSRFFQCGQPGDGGQVLVSQGVNHAFRNSAFI